ncbi:L-ascorbate oxidase-like [Macadamia integrifolia]|uniref:L-ascorbate oxidase-like n=1 Tax=Macadamia integrifolia TaxID=60698 RepID=UPI001C4F227E|nr:L-ascorbate oxidase-like [Macadamia integrifolia]
MIIPFHYPRLPLGFLLLITLFLVSLLTLPTVEARIRHYKWEVKYEYKSQDCYKKLVITINGKTPGPSIIAQQGDTVVVELKNSLLTENVAIHWHGIRQIGTPWSDGTEGVTQCPILPGETHTYKYVVDKPGTYLYHAHYGMQRAAGLYGSIRVSVPDGVAVPFSYDYDRSIILTDLYHNSTYEQATGLSSKPFVWVGEPQSLLIQGRGRYNCSLLSSSSLEAGLCNTTNPECSPYFITVVPGKTYRLRISSLTSLSALNFEIEGHNMTVVETDGHYVEPFVIKNLNIYSGETYSVLVKADQDSSRNYWAAVNVISRKPQTPTGLAIFNYYPNHPRRSPTTTPPTGSLWNDSDYLLAQSLAIKARQGYIEPPPLTSDRVITFLNTQNQIDGYRKWAVNNVSFTLPNTPYLIALKQNWTHVFDQSSPPENYDSANYDIYSTPKNFNATSSNAIYRLKFNSTVDVILQNGNTMIDNNSETHPWHLHGHDFWVLSYGKGKFDSVNDPKKYNLVNPIKKNTVPLHSYGWTALRFRANNPGVWAFHCHIEPHFYMGMGVVFEEGVEKVGKLPTSIMGCGETKSLIRP